MKISILRRLFALYKADPMDLVFYLKDIETEKVTDSTRYETRRKYWTYALPLIKKQNAHRGTFANNNPITSNTIAGSFGIGGFGIFCMANYDSAGVQLNLSKYDAADNKKAFDKLYAHKDAIETEVGANLNWVRADDKKASWVSYFLPGVSVGNESDWPRMAKFHAEWSDRLCNVMLPYLQDVQLDDKTARRQEIASYLREWAAYNTKIRVDLAHCCMGYTRFTTQGMTEMFPDIPNAPSGWNTANHYFYEIVNSTGSRVYIQLAFSSRNITDDLREKCDRLNAVYPAKVQKDNWQWRALYRTESIEIPEKIDKDELYKALDERLEQIEEFEAEARKILQE